jgi:predicted N-formylglutamate amidohydrolase
MSQLLQDDEPPPVKVLCEHGPSDLFLTADHAGRAIPRGLGRLGLPESELVRHIGWDRATHNLRGNAQFHASVQRRIA